MHVALFVAYRYNPRYSYGALHTRAPRNVLSKSAAELRCPALFLLNQERLANISTVHNGLNRGCYIQRVATNRANPICVLRGSQASNEAAFAFTSTSRSRI